MAKQALGHSSIKYVHSVGIGDGAGLGRSVGNIVGPGDGRGDGSTVGPGDGTGEGRSDGFDDGKPLGPDDGTGEGSGVGLQSSRSCGFKHLSGQQAQVIPVGSGKVLQTVLPTEAQLTGRSSGSVSQHATGHSSIKWLHAVGLSDGVAEGPTDASMDGAEEGAGEGIIVGEQIGGLPSGCISNIG